MKYLLSSLMFILIVLRNADARVTRRTREAYMNSGGHQAAVEISDDDSHGGVMANKSSAQARRQLEGASCEKRGWCFNFFKSTKEKCVPCDLWVAEPGTALSSSEGFFWTREPSECNRKKVERKKIPCVLEKIVVQRRGACAGRGRIYEVVHELQRAKKKTYHVVVHHQVTFIMHFQSARRRQKCAIVIFTPYFVVKKECVRAGPMESVRTTSRTPTPSRRIQ